MLNEVELFFFFKQKTAYEVRISDWSSDVCSSDLQSISRRFQRRSPAFEVLTWSRSPSRMAESRPIPLSPRFRPPSLFSSWRDLVPIRRKTLVRSSSDMPSPVSRTSTEFASARSEEHTSELQSLMRIPYAVFCLKTNKLSESKVRTNRSTNRPYE